MLTIFFTNRWIIAYKKSFTYYKGEITRPYIKIIMTIGESFVDSKLLSAIINVKQVGGKFKEFFVNYVQALNHRYVEISTEDSRVGGVDRYPVQWSREESFYLDCSITFNYDGEYKHELQIAEKFLLSQERILNI